MDGEPTWRFDPVDPEANASLARFVSQRDWFVDEIVGAAFRGFARLTSNACPDFRSAVELDDPAVTRHVVGSLYNQARSEFGRRAIRYEYERAFDGRSGRQRVLTGSEIVRGRNATCLDLALLGASLLAQVKLRALVVILVLDDGVHAVAAVHVRPPAADRPCVDRIAALLRAVASGDALVVDFTAATCAATSRRSPINFTRAVALAEDSLRRAEKIELASQAMRRSVVVDVWRAWELGHHPFSAEEVDTLRRRLKPPDFGTRIAGLARGFVGRERLLGEIAAWAKESTAHRVFWVVGEPGVGKSAIAAKSSQLLRHLVGAHHFCSHDDGWRSEIRGIASSIAFQLGEHLPGYHAWLMRQDLAALLSGDPERLLDALLVDGPAESGPASASPWLVVVDALDEATRDGSNPVAQFIGRRAARHALPPGLKFLVTSRAAPAVMRPMSSIRPWRIESAAPDNLSDIRRYLSTQVSNGLPPADIDRIAEHSGGLFLYVHAALESLRAGGAPTALPRGLGEWLRQDLARRFADAFELYDTLARPLLEVVGAALAPIPKGLLAAVYGVDGPIFQQALDRLSDVLEVVDQEVRFRHLAFKELLADGESSGEYVLDIDRGRERLIEACWRIGGAGATANSDYCIGQIAPLLCAVGRWEHLAHVLLRRDFGIFDRWIDNGETAAGIDVLTRLIRFLEQRAGHRHLVAGFATQVARLHLQRQAFEEARPWLERVLRDTSWFSARRLRAIGLHELASLELYEGRHAVARRLFRRALWLTLLGLPRYHDEAAGNRLGLAMLGDGRTAIRHGKRALEHARRARDNRHVVAAGRVLAAAYKRGGEFEVATLHLEQAMDVADQHEIALERSHLLAERASIRYWTLSAEGIVPLDARPCYVEALEAARKVRDHYGALRVLTTLGLLALHAHDTAEAELHFGAVRAGLRPGSHVELHVHVALGQACVRHQLGDLRSAAIAYREVIDSCAALPTWYLSDRAAALVGLGAARWHLNERNEAARVWLEAEKLTRRLAGLKRMTLAGIERCRADSKNVSF